jgi:alcohol dehydrogenase (cytochrome c)
MKIRILPAMVLLPLVTGAPIIAAQTIDQGLQVFASHCASCHGSDGNGGELGPEISSLVPNRSDEELHNLFMQGLPNAGMPAFVNLPEAETVPLIAFLRTLKPRFGSGPARGVAQVGNQTIEGLVLNQGHEDMQLLDDDRRLHILRKEGDNWRAATSQVDWTSYNGDYNGSRYSTMEQINNGNIADLNAKWVFNMRNTNGLQVTPVVSEGVMYVTSANEAYALDAGTGREIWHYRRQRTRGLIGNAAGGVNRGVALAGDQVFMVTDNAHIIALNKYTGALLWDTVMADWRQNYNATVAPLAIGNLVIAGTSGGDEGVRGFVAAYDQDSGEEVWRLWTTPLRGEPGSETWIGDGIDHPAGSTWMTGAYDSELNLLYWTVGNPGPDMIGDDRLGDNLYTDSVLAINPDTGELQWYFQFTPHDVWDYDAQETLALVDAQWQGQARKLMVQANRNGFFYVLDRTNGQFLFGTPFVSNITWASGLDQTGRPIVVPGMEPTLEGNRVCPSLVGATNWYSTSWNPKTALYYVQTNDMCGIFTRIDMKWEAGKGYMGGSFALEPEPSRRVLRAIDINTGKAAWELPQAGSAGTWGGVLSTAGNVVVFGDNSGALMAADAVTGDVLWNFPLNTSWKSSPMTYMFDNEQYIAIAAGSNIVAFGLPSNP